MYAQVLLVFICQCLLNIVFSINKALNGQILPSVIYIIPTFQCYLKTLLLLMLAFLFFALPFLYQIL